MRYSEILFGRFVARPNRFLALVELEGKVENCHVKNTSRLRELLLPGAAVTVQRAKGPQRKTAYDLIGVEHQGIWVNVDSQAPNRVFGEWARASGYFGEISLLRPEAVYQNSRFDFYMEAGERKIYVEVKGVTLVEGGVARFPGAPTTRGVKHLCELASCRANGYEALLAFVVKREDVAALVPNDEMDPAFGAALRQAAGQGVGLLGLGCRAGPNSLEINRFVRVRL